MACLVGGADFKQTSALKSRLQTNFQLVSWWIITLGEDPASPQDEKEFPFSVNSHRHGFRFDRLFVDFVDDSKRLAFKACTEQVPEAQALHSAWFLFGNVELYRTFKLEQSQAKQRQHSGSVFQDSSAEMACVR